MFEKYLTPDSKKVALVFGLGIPHFHLWTTTQFWTTWDYVDQRLSKSFLKFIAFCNVLVLALLISFLGNNFIEAIGEDINFLTLGLFLVILLALYLPVRDTARLIYYLSTGKIRR